jgi:hypothetical protein
VAWFLELHDRRQLELDPPYQRRSVWNDEYKRYFVDTVLRGYPSPSIFIDVTIKPGAPATYNVIDGKQRLTSLIEFSEDVFDLGSLLKDLDLEDTYYSELPESMQKDFLEYTLTVETINGAKAELEAAFDRLNRNVARLNAQELRNARFSGEFIKLMTELADEEFWTKVGTVSTRARVRRMLDVEFVSELFILTMHGIQDGKASLDTYYADYDEEIPEEMRFKRDFRRILRYLDSLELDWRYTRFRNLADLYSLWAAIRDLQEANRLPDPDDAVERLQALEERIVAGQDEGAQRYLIAARQGSNKDTNRDFRKQILEAVLSD